MAFSIKSPDFWIEQWQQSLSETAAFHKDGYVAAGTWNKMAGTYGAGRLENKDNDSREEDLIAKLRQTCGLGRNARVLDVGCGTGRMAIPLARNGFDVTALDFSQGMLDRFRRAIPDSLESRIHVVEMDWENVELRSLEWEQSFDLVFASMTPAIKTPDSFLKLHRASRGGCCFQGWAGRRSDPLLEGLWKHLRNETMPAMGWDITIAFNLLYSMGLAPSIEFQEVSWEKEEAVTDAADFFSGFFSGMEECSGDSTRERIARYLDSVADNRRVTRKTNGRTGTLIWNVR